jgi:hypothetical protein
MMASNLHLNSLLGHPSSPQLSSGPLIFFAFAALILSGCIHINVTEELGDSRSNEGHAIYQDTARNDQDPSSPGEIVEPLSDYSALPAGNECRLESLIHHRQQTGSWCWAASTLTAIEFIRKLDHDENNDQCELVNTVFAHRVGKANTNRNCTSSSPSNECVHCCKAKRDVSVTASGAGESRSICDKGLWPEEVLNNPAINPNGQFLIVSYPPFDDLQGWEDLTGQICRRLPYLTVVRWAGGGRHAVAIGGYSSPPGEGEYVHVYDPGAQGFYIMPFQDFYNGIPRKFAHEQDYFNIGQ